MRGLQSYVNASGLEESLLELVKMRASQVNGCAYCLDMHSKDARAAGETEQRLEPTRDRVPGGGGHVSAARACRSYSALSVSIGSTAAARRAGT